MSKKKFNEANEPALNRKNFLEALKPGVTFKTIEGLGTIGISLLSTAERLELIEEWKCLETDAGQQLLATLKLLPKVLTDADGKKLLTPDDLEALKHSNAQLVDELIHAALEINGMTKKSVDALEKKLGSSPERLAVFALAEKLGKTKAEILEISSLEFSEWMAYFQWQQKHQEEQQKRAELDARCQQNMAVRKRQRS